MIMKEEALEKITTSGDHDSLENSRNVRIVLPHSSHPPQRRVIAPGCSYMNTNTSLQGGTPLLGQNVQDQKEKDAQSKPALSTKEYKEYLEDMELKIRYMKNDIEFKQNQIQNKKIQSAQTGTQNIQINRPLGHEKRVLTSTLVNKGRKVIPTPAYRTNFQVHHRHVAPVSSYLYAQGSHFKSTNIVNTSSFPSKSFLKLAKTTPKAVEVSASLPSSASVCSLPSSSEDSIHVRLPVQTENKSNIPLISENNSQQFSKVINTSVFQGPGGLSSVTPAKPIYVSPSKNQAIWSHSPDGSIIMCPSLKERQEELSTSFDIYNKEKIPDLTITTSQTFQSSSSSSKSVVSASKYKLVKTNTSSLTAPTPSLVPNTPSASQTASRVESKILPHSNIIHFSKKSIHKKSVSKSSPKSKVYDKIVSKYKMTRLSPNTVSTRAPQLFNSQVSEERPPFAQPALNLDQREPGIMLQKASIYSTPQSKLPKLEVVMAAKLVSKYRWKRLSPTSALKTPPQLLYNNSKFSGTSHSQHVFSKCNMFSKHKLSYHQLDSSASLPQPFKSKVLASHTPLKKSSLVQQRGLLGLHGQRRRFVLDRRDGMNLELKTGVRTAVKNRHKLDRRPQKSSAPGDLTKASGMTMGKKKGQHRWVSATSSTSPGFGFNQRQNSYSSTFKWRPHSGDSLFKWPKERSSIEPNTWDSFSRNQRGALLRRRSNLVMIRGVVYKSHWQASSHKIRRHPFAEDTFNAQARPSKTNLKLITLRGVRFHTDFQGKKLCRAGQATGSPQNKSKEPYERKRHKSQTKAVDGTTILAASRVVHRSIVVAAAKFKKDNTKCKREKQNCIFFNRFGKCHRGEKCKYLHDPEKVAVCTRFLRGKCDETRCQFSHNASEHKMPVCLHYLQGLCSRDNCPYLHVRVNPDAPVCKDFRNGYCPLGKKCKKLHSLVCPSFAVVGQCSRGESCSLLHRRIKREHKSTDHGVNTKQKVRKRGRLSSRGESAPKGRITETSIYAVVEPKSQEGTALELDSSINAIGDQSPSQGFSKAGKPICQIQTEDSNTLLGQEERSKARADMPLSHQSTALTVAASPKKGSAPLALQPSFISLLAESPVNPYPESPAHVRELGPDPSIKPLFIAQRLAMSGQYLDNSSLSGDSNSKVTKSDNRKVSLHKPVPKPAFLSNRVLKGDGKLEI